MTAEERSSHGWGFAGKSTRTRRVRWARIAIAGSLLASGIVGCEFREWWQGRNSETTLPSVDAAIEAALDPMSDQDARVAAMGQGFSYANRFVRFLQEQAKAGKTEKDRRAASLLLGHLKKRINSDD